MKTFSDNFNALIVKELIRRGVASFPTAKAYVSGNRDKLHETTIQALNAATTEILTDINNQSQKVWF